MDYRNGAAPCNPAHMCENLLKSYDKVLRSYKKAVAQFAYNLATEICKNGHAFDDGARAKPGCNMPTCPFAKASRLAEEECFQKRPPSCRRPSDKQRSSTNCGSPDCPFNLAPAPPPTPEHCSYEDLSPKSPCQNPNCPFGQKQPVGPCGSTKCPFAVSFEPIASRHSCKKSPDSDNRKVKDCNDPKCPFSSASATNRQTCGDPNCPFETTKKRTEVSDQVSKTSRTNSVKEQKRSRLSSSKHTKSKSESKRSSSKTKRRVSSKEPDNKHEKKDTQTAAKRKPSSPKSKKPKSSKVSQRSSNSTEPSPKKKRSSNTSTMTDTTEDSPKLKKSSPSPSKNSAVIECVNTPSPTCSCMTSAPRCPNPRCPMNPPCPALYQCLQSQTPSPSFQPQSRMLLTSISAPPANSTSNLCSNPACPVKLRQGVTKQLYVEIGNPCSSSSGKSRSSR